MAYHKTSRRITLYLGVMLIWGLGSLLVACSSTQIPTTSIPKVECPETTIPKPARYEDLWATSAHADASAEAFNHWDEEDPPEIPKECAKCHSRPGFIDFLGVDGTTENNVDNPAQIGTTISCFVCHNEVSDDITSVVFPSGVKIRELGSENRCIQCHYGRESKLSIDKTIAEINFAGDNIPSDEVSFIDSHAISAATPFGAEVRGAYEYPGKSYKGRFIRGDEFFACIRCHDPHNLELKSDTCSDCHTITGSDIKEIRVDTTDFDGDSDIQEGIAHEIEFFQLKLDEAIKSYALEVVGKGIVYDPQSYPYYFIDQNNDGEIDPGEATFENQYTPWTPRLLRAAYNYNYVTNDPGAYAHNSDYTIQILFDSIVDLEGSYSELTRP